jgi:hypothetical protein
MFERKVSVRNIVQALQSGEVIEDYSAEMPQPGRLILGFQGKRPFHVVVSEDPETGQRTVITVYLPNPEKWTKDSKSRRS